MKRLSYKRAKKPSSLKMIEKLTKRFELKITGERKNFIVENNR